MTFPEGESAPKKKSSVIWADSWNSPQFPFAEHLTYEVGDKGWKYSCIPRCTMRGRDDHPWLRRRNSHRISAIVNWRGARVASLKYAHGDVTFGGLPEAVKVITTKKGQRMAFAEIGDFGARVEVVFFPEVWRGYGRPVRLGQAVIIHGYIEKDADGRIKVIAESVGEMPDQGDRFARLYEEYGVTP